MRGGVGGRGIVRGKATQPKAFCEQTLEIAAKLPELGNREQLATRPRCSCSASATRSSARCEPSRASPLRTGRYYSCRLTRTTRPACSSKASSAGWKMKSARRHASASFSCEIDPRSRATDGPHPTTASSHGATVICMRHGYGTTICSRRPRYSASHAAVPRLLAASRAERRTRARQSRLSASGESTDAWTGARSRIETRRRPPDYPPSGMWELAKRRDGRGTR